jgi:hypothetical protein
MGSSITADVVSSLLKQSRNLLTQRELVNHVTRRQEIRGETQQRKPRRA